MKQVYFYDKTTKLFSGDGVIYEQEDGTYVMPSNAIDVQPVGFYTPKLNTAKTGWIEGDKAAALTLAIEAKLSSLYDEYTGLVEAGVTYNGATFQSDKYSISNIVEVLTTMNSGCTMPAGFAWMDASNTPHPADLPFMQGLAQAIADHKASLFMRLATAKAAVRAATTKTAIQAVTL